MHKHHIVPTYRGGSDDPSNLVPVSVVQHAMFHFCNWQLWGDKRDWLAWKGLTGEIGKEEIVRELRLEGARKGREASIARGSTPARREAARRSVKLATAAANKPEVKEKRKQTLRQGIEALTEEEKKLRFGRPQTPEILRKKSERQRPWRSLTVETPDGVVEVEGCLSQIAEQLGIPAKSMQPLIRKGKVIHLGLRLLCKNPW